MEFRTPVTLTPAGFSLSLQSPLLTMGSCFAEVMGDRLQQNKFPVIVNPFGTVFNPVSLARLLRLSLGSEAVSDTRLVVVEQQWYHYDFHSRFAAATAENLMADIHQTISQVTAFLATAHCLVLTLGTATVYRLRNDQQVVANCHKVPAGLFEKSMLSWGEVLTPLEILFSKLFSHYPSLQIILTVSPVRHIKDTLVTNGASKSLLRAACHQLAAQFTNVSYFPAYEIMLDDLRDYRFYKADMIHPSGVAEDYIWQIFTQTYLDIPARQFLQTWAKIKQSLAHRPFHKNTVSYQIFLNKLAQQLSALQHQADVSAEIAEVRNQLNSIQLLE